MRVYSITSSTIKFACVLALCVITMCALVIIVPSSSEAAGGTISYSEIYSNNDRVEFISKFGWTVDPTPVGEVEVEVPDVFDSAYASYNDIQTAQGLNLEKYKGKTVVKYTYGITNYENYDGAVYVNLLVYKNKIIGGDVSSADASGFVFGFSGEDQSF